MTFTPLDANQSGTLQVRPFPLSSLVLKYLNRKVNQLSNPVHDPIFRKLFPESEGHNYLIEMQPSSLNHYYWRQKEKGGAEIDFLLSNGQKL